MDLKDVIADVREKAIEAHNAFHAGHGDVSEKYLLEIAEKIVEYLEITIPKKVDVTEATDIQTPANEQTEKPAAAPGASLHPGPFGPDAAARQAGHPEEAEKQTQ